MSAILKPVRTRHLYEVVLVTGNFKAAGTGTTAPTDVDGEGFTVAQTATGVFAVTFSDLYAKVLAFIPSVTVSGETTDLYAQPGDITAATGAVGEVRGIRTMTAGTPTSPHADAGHRIDFVALVALRT
jgi:hypothetical protein